MPDDDISQLTVAQLGRQIQRKAISPVEVAQACLRRLEALQPRLHAVITLLAEQALESAQAAEAELLEGRYRGPFHGVPVGLKDLFWTKGVRTTSGSAVEGDFVPSEDSAVAERFAEAGAYCIAKLNMPEFAFDPVGRNPHYGTVCNPWDLERTPGGSSSGSAALLAARAVPLAMGTDTGGSLRIPAALSGVTGLKPTYGLISRYGVTPLSWTLDHVGPLARTVQDVALAMNVLAGHDPRDPGSARSSPQDYTRDLDRGVRGLRIGVPREYVWELMDPEVEAAFKAAMAQLESLGAKVDEISIPELDYTGALSSAISPTEAAAYHGGRLLAEGHRYDQSIRRRMETGLFAPATTYLQAQRARVVYSRKLREALGRVDLLATPVTPIPAPPNGQDHVTIGGREVPLREVLLRLTRIFNISGMPAISVPCGFSDGGLPMGLQLAGKPFDDVAVLRGAHAYQQATDWHLRRPPI